MQYFYESQTASEKKLYAKLLTIIGSLSNLFAETENPFLHYRIMENIFCKAFNADNFSRSDISIDAGKNTIGIGLKTFLQNNGNTFQKIAEFNKQSYLLVDKKPEEKILKVAKMRNERILTTMRICKTNTMIYHLLTRAKNTMLLFEEPMNLIDIDKIRITKKTNSTIHFTDNIELYEFSTAKNTLLKKFNTSQTKAIEIFPVNILSNPFDFLLQLENELAQKFVTTNQATACDYIVLPLYSPATNTVEPKSGLNQWNAAGRRRNLDEVYIPVPSWIHKLKNNFFHYNTDDHKTDKFNVQLPDKTIISMKLAQAGGKALMSDPNKALGKWILRDVLHIDYGTLVTKEMLDIIGIDSIKLTKISDELYTLDFLEQGSFKKFKATLFSNEEKHK